jgi:mannose-6-phosphate isomerase-like protein (cupin superfamily)
VVQETRHAAVVAWTVKPGQRISPHVHPAGQDAWTVITGEGAYQVDASGRTERIAAGDIAVAPRRDLTCSKYRIRSPRALDLSGHCRGWAGRAELRSAWRTIRRAIR